MIFAIFMSEILQELHAHILTANAISINGNNSIVLFGSGSFLEFQNGCHEISKYPPHNTVIHHISVCGTPRYLILVLIHL